MPTVFIFHGIYGHPDENWFPWLKKELEQRGCTVHIPHFPTTDHLVPQDWEKVFQPFEAKLTNDVILIAHSLGCAFVLKLIERHPVRAIFLVAPAVGKTANEFTPMMQAIADQAFTWALIRKHCGHAFIFHAANDPYLPMAVAERLAHHLQTEVIRVPDAGHFNTAAGYTEFPMLLEKIEEVL